MKKRITIGSRNNWCFLGLCTEHERVKKTKRKKFKTRNNYECFWSRYFIKSVNQKNPYFNHEKDMQPIEKSKYELEVIRLIVENRKQVLDGNKLFLSSTIIKNSIITE